MLRMDPYFSQTMVGSLDNVSAEVQNLTLELSSGVRVNSISDDPAAAADDLMLRGQDAVDTQFVQSAGAAESKLQLMDSVLGNVVAQMTTAVTLATEGLNGTMSSADVQATGKELAGIRDEVLSLGNTSYLGQYIFSGSQTETQPFTLDSGSSPAVATYNGDNETVYEDTPSGQKIATGFSGDALFGSGTGVLSTLNQLVADFSTGTLPASAQSDAAALTTALNSLNGARAGVDTSLSRMQSAGSYAQTEETQLQSSENTLVQADFADVTTDLKNVETQQTALYSVMAMINQNNLFSYLKG